MTNINDTLRQRVVGPITDLMLLNIETTAAILLRQGAAISEVVSQGVGQAKQLTEADGIQDAMHTQQKYLRGVAQQLTEAGRENIQTIRDSGEKARDVIRSAFSSQPEDQPTEDIATAA